MVLHLRVKRQVSKTGWGGRGKHCSVTLTASFGDTAVVSVASLLCCHVAAAETWTDVSAETAVLAVSAASPCLCRSDVSARNKALVPTPRAPVVFPARSSTPTTCPQRPSLPQLLPSSGAPALPSAGTSTGTPSFPHKPKGLIVSSHSSPVSCPHREHAAPLGKRQTDTASLGPEHLLGAAPAGSRVGGGMWHRLLLGW